MPSNSSQLTHTPRVPIFPFHSPKRVQEKVASSFKIISFDSYHNYSNSCLIYRRTDECRCEATKLINLRAKIGTKFIL